jgi:DNA-binding MarR family transcriptional regulator
MVKLYQVMKMIPLQQHVNIRETLQLLVRRFGLFQKEGAQCCGVSVIQSHVLYELRKRPNQSLNDLADKLALDTSSLSRQVQQLVELNLINRVPDPKDRRYVLLSLTKEGEKKDLEIANLMTVYIQNLLQFIPEEKHQQVIESLDLLSNAMRQSPNCCTPPM